MLPHGNDLKKGHRIMKRFTKTTLKMMQLLKR